MSKYPLACALAALFVFWQAVLPEACAQVPQVIGFQGRMAVNGVNHDGPGQFKFAIINADGTTTHWSNDGTSTAGSAPTGFLTITVTKGLYAVMLGDTTAGMQALPATLFNQTDLRLRVWFNDGALGFQQLAPDQRVASVGYAMMAGNVADGAVTNTKLAAGAVSSTKLGTGAVTSSKLGTSAVTTDKIEDGAVTPQKLSASQNFTLTNTGELFVREVSTDEPPRTLLGSVTIQWGAGSDVSTTVTLVASPARENTYQRDPLGELSPQSRGVTDCVLRRPLLAGSKWDEWVKETADREEALATVTLQFTSGPTVTMGNAFPLAYSIERGADNIFYETMTVRPRTYSAQ